MKQSIKYSLQYVLCSYTLFFHIVCLSFNTKLPALSKFFKPVTVELFRLFLKPFSHGSLDFRITCEINSFEMSSFTTSGSASVGSSIVMLKKHCLPPSLWQTQLICCFYLFGSSHKSWNQFSSKRWPTFCLFRSCVEVTGLLDHGWLLRPKFPSLSLNFLT